MAPTCELGHLAKARCISPTKVPSLEFLVEALFSCKMKKGEDSPRLSNWSIRSGLVAEQITHAGADVHATIKSHEKLMTIMNPRREGRLRNTELRPNTSVMLYNHNWTSKAAIADIVDGTTVNSLVQAVIKSEDSVLTPDSIAPVLQATETVGDSEESRDAAEAPQRATLGVLLQAAKETADVGAMINIGFCWPRRLIRKHTPTPEAVTVATKEVVVEKDHDAGDDDDNEPDVEWAAASRGDATAAALSAGDSDDSSTGSTDVPNAVPRSSKRRRIFRLHCERIKQDILHIFLRCQRVMSKNHGTHAKFMAALRDALCIACQEDIDFVVHHPKDHGLTEEQTEWKL